jgi:hypothetical protein
LEALGLFRRVRVGLLRDAVELAADRWPVDSVFPLGPPPWVIAFEDYLQNRFHL